MNKTQNDANLDALNIAIDRQAHAMLDITPPLLMCQDPVTPLSRGARGLRPHFPGILESKPARWSQVPEA
jgi:hypothetical protein